jgi:transposase
MHRYALTDESWARVRQVLPRPARTGRPPRDAREILEGVLWVLATGAPWRDLPARFGPWQTIYGRFRTWVASRVLDRLLDRLQRAFASEARLDMDLWCVDTTVIRASRAAGGARRTERADEPEDHALGRSRGGFGTKLALACDGRGHPLAAVVAPGQQHDVRSFSDVVASALRFGRPCLLAGDKAYSVAWVRRWLRRRRIQPVIPTRIDQQTDPHFRVAAYRRRNVVERLVGWLKESRRVATRYEKLAVNYLALVKLAMIRRLLRVAEFSDRP